MLLMIDNYDSFTYMIVQYLRELGAEVMVKRNDAIALSEIEELQPSHIVISPGPCTPNESGISLSAISHFAGKIPLLGVCLGHQAIAQVFGGTVVRAQKVMHGKTSQVYHHAHTLFQHVPLPFRATRYHSLIVEKESLPDCLEITAWTQDDEIMGLCHSEFPIYGVQFHPESVMTEYGHTIFKNFLTISNSQ